MNCGRCDGSGQITVLEAGYSGWLRDPATAYTDTCPACRGTGEVA